MGIFGVWRVGGYITLLRSVNGRSVYGLKRI